MSAKHYQIDLSHTKVEIFQQPKLWEKVFECIQENKSLPIFLKQFLIKSESRIILTGAGSSAFIGEAIAGIIQRTTNRIVQPIATTNLITNPEDYFFKTQPTLLVSFARSGNSPESLEAINIANNFCDTVYHLVITCNKDGELAVFGKEDKNTYSIILPEETNDKSLAMTSSFTSMLLAAILAFQYENLEELHKPFENVLAAANNILEQSKSIKAVAQLQFSRAVFLGSGSLLGIARECHLKLQELTDGQVMCSFDSYLGFRHGPRAIANENTLLIYLSSDNEHVRKYEADLVYSIDKETPNVKAICIGSNNYRKVGNIIETFGNTPDNSNDLYILPFTIVGQLLGFYKSLDLGLNPDNPSVNGSISRVVQGVTIYKK